MDTKENFKIRIGEEFKPSPQFKRLYYIYSTPAILVCISIFVKLVDILTPFFDPLWVTLIVSISILAILIPIAYWIPKYCDSMSYKLTENEIVWRRGVWVRRTGIVPYNRITNIDIVQGPISRKLGLASLKIQTAGYSAPSRWFGGLAEIRIDGVEQFEELRELIMEFVRGKKPE